MSGQLYTPVILSLDRGTAPKGQKAGRVREPVWTRYGEERNTCPIILTSVFSIMLIFWKLEHWIKGSNHIQGMYVRIYLCMYVCLYVSVILCCVALCSERLCNEPILRARSPSMCLKRFIVSEVFWTGEGQRTL